MSKVNVNLLLELLDGDAKTKPEAKVPRYRGPTAMEIAMAKRQGTRQDTRGSSIKQLEVKFSRISSHQNEVADRFNKRWSLGRWIRRMKATTPMVPSKLPKKWKTWPEGGTNW